MTISVIMNHVRGIMLRNHIMTGAAAQADKQGTPFTEIDAPAELAEPTLRRRRSLLIQASTRSGGVAGDAATQ